MSQKKSTLKQHTQRAFAINLMRDFVFFLAADLVSESHPLISDAAKCAEAALEKLDSLRGELEKEALSENPNILPELIQGIYFGPRPWHGKSELLALFEHLRQELADED